MNWKKEVLSWKEGMFIGLATGFLVYIFRDKAPWIITNINTWFGPFTDQQLMWVLLLLGFCLGTVFDALYKPGQ